MDTKDQKHRGKIRFRLYILFWLTLLASATVAIFSKAIDISEYTRMADETRAMIDNETTKAARLELSREYYGSDAFVEKIAREQLDLVMPDEILFYNDAKS
ncbi:MAG: septum formation initiator family protein [Clostridiales bacterium]|nr:septum formation initiator family protein [Clostridiales bacterium]